jgi:uncharacterized membrane protein YfcA
LSIIGVALVQITPQLDLNGTEQGLVGASALIGIFLGAFVGGWLTDRFGRQILFTVDLIAIIFCSGRSVLRQRRVLADRAAAADRHGGGRRLPDRHLAAGRVLAPQVARPAARRLRHHVVRRRRRRLHRR